MRESKSLVLPITPLDIKGLAPLLVTLRLWLPKACVHIKMSGHKLIKLIYCFIILCGQTFFTGPTSLLRAAAPDIPFRLSSTALTARRIAMLVMQFFKLCHKRHLLKYDNPQM